MNEYDIYIKELVEKITTHFTTISRDDYNSIVYELLNVKNLQDYLTVSALEVRPGDIFILLMKCKLSDENHTIQKIFQILKEAWAFISYDNFEASEISSGAEKLEFKFVSISNSNKFFSGKIIISGNNYEKSYKNYLDFLDESIM
jgi:hypothetical protein